MIEVVPSLFFMRLKVVSNQKIELLLTFDHMTGLVTKNFSGDQKFS
jgi:hypothetical protein